MLDLLYLIEVFLSYYDHSNNLLYNDVSKFIDLEREKYISKFLGIDSKDAAENFIENIKTINDQK